MNKSEKTKKVKKVIDDRSLSNKIYAKQYRLPIVNCNLWKYVKTKSITCWNPTLARDLFK